MIRQAMLPYRESIAITGVSGRYPSCNSVQELEDSLLDGKDLVTTDHDRWGHECLETSHRMGLVQDWAYFDAGFFGLNPKEANVDDPKLRKLLEVVYEAVVDAGINPGDLRGTRTGVFLGVTQNCYLDTRYRGGIAGRSISIYANMISFAFDFKGPSYGLDSVCASGLYAFSQAMDALLLDRCSTAIVCAAQSQFDPAESMELIKIGVLHQEGICRSFSVNRKGYVKSEAVVAIVLQKVEESKRIYATVCGAGTNVDGFKVEGLANPSALMQRTLLEDIYEKFDVDPLDVNYVEAHATGTKVGDIAELKSIDEFFCKSRENPLLIGCVKANVGHSEGASGLVSLTKVIIAIQGGIIPKNIYYDCPDPEMNGILEGRLKVNERNTPLPSGLIAINAMGFGGTNGSIVIRPYNRRNQITNKLPYRLVQASGRTEEAVQVLLDRIVENRTNEELLSLIDNIHSKPIDGHNYRGYAVLSENSHTEINQGSFKSRPLWYVFSGVGAQWSKMGRDLMKIETFRNTMQKCALALKPYGVDLVDLVVNGPEEVYDNLINIYVGITSVSVSLVDVLNEMNIVPDGIIGHSLGEIGCAYVDGLITPEQAVLIAYARGYSIISSDLPPGLMAAVGLSLEECVKMLPKDVYIACDNSEDNVTITGAEQAVRDFTEELNAKGIFNRIVNSSRKALHSPLLEPAGPKLYDFVKKVLPEVKPRSKKWLPSAILEEEWDSELGRLHSAEYHHHNFLNPVQFKQLLKYIPKDAIVVEVAPRGLLQGILKRSLDSSVTLVPLVKPGADNYDFFLSSIGRFFINGGKLNLTNYYNTVNQPAGIGTPIISNWIKWDHRVKWDTPKFNHQSGFGLRMEMDTSDQSYQFMEGHVNDGRIILPAMGYVFLAWKALAKMMAVHYLKLPVVFENVKALRPTLLPPNDLTSFIVNIFQSTGYFEICLENELEPFATGRVYVAKEEELEPQTIPEFNPYKCIDNEDFYQHMHMRGFDYGGIFKGVQQISLDGRLAKIRWNNNWIAFLDNVVHSVLAMQETGYCLPSKFEKIVINPQQHLKSFDEESNFVRTHDKASGVVRCGGVEVTNIGVSHVKRHVSQIPPTTGKYTFVPSVCTQNESDPLVHSLHVCFQILLENTVEQLTLKVVETGSTDAINILKTFKEQTMNLNKTTFKQASSLEDIIDSDIDFLITQDVDQSLLDALYSSTKKARFVFAKVQNVELKNVDVVFEEKTDSGSYVLIRRYQTVPEEHTVIVASNENFAWAEDLKVAIKTYQHPNSRIYLVNDDFNSGVVGLFSCVRLELNVPNLRVFFVRTKDKIEKFSTRSKFYMDQIRKDLTVNVFQDGEWGSYKCLSLKPFVPTLQSSARLMKTRNGINWIQKSPYCCNKEVAVHYASLTRWDVSTITDIEEERLGLEYSGVDKNGNNVMGLVNKCALATSVQAHPQLVWTIPEKLSFEQAATIPLAYTLGYYSLFVRSQLSQKDSILIHNCTSDISMAAIVLALNKGCTIYVTVDPETYAGFVKEANSKSERVNIIVHTTTKPFYQTIMRKTGGRGIDYVFNCKTLDLLLLSMKCIVRNGKIVEIDNGISDYTIADEVLDKNCSYYNATLSEVFDETPEVLAKVSSGIDKYLKDGHIVPLSSTVFDKYDVKSAVKYLESTGFNKKCLIKIKEKNGFFAKPENRVLAYPRTFFDPKKSYVVIGGLGGFGMELSNWIVERGATKIILNGRRGIHNGYQALYLQTWKNNGVTVLIDTSDSSTMEGAVSLLQHASNLAPVGGIFNAALVVRDMLVTEQTVEDFIAVAEPKIYSCQNMDIASRQLCKKLDHFVYFSSVASSLGNAVQSSYGYVNSAMERVCEVRKAEGLPSLVVEWAPLGDVGFVARMKTKIKIIDAIPQATYSCLEVVDKFMQQEAPIVFSCVYGDEVDNANEEKSLIQSIAQLFGIKDVNSVDDFVTLADLGMDSLLGFEIKHMLTKECGQDFSVNDIRNMTIEAIKAMSA